MGGYVEHVVLGVVHDMGGQRVEGEEVGHLLLLLPVDRLSGADHVGVDDLVARQEVVLDLLVGVVELDHELAEWGKRYERPSLSSLATPKMSFLFIGRSSGIVTSSGRLYSFFTIGIVWFCCRAENFISISFLGSSERW